MQTKKPLISYVVKTQYVTNNAGLKTLYIKVFTDENIVDARKKAFEYYKAAIHVLENEGEITKDVNSEKITYKNPENYDQGIGIYLRINEDVNKFGIADKADTKYMIEAHYNLSNREARSMKVGKETERKYFELLKLNFEQDQKNKIPFSAIRLGLLAKLNRIKSTSFEKIDFVDYRDREESVEQLLESACAFLNTNGGTIIFGQNPSMDDDKDLHNIFGNAFIIEKLLTTSFPNEKQHFTFNKRNLLGCQFLEITINKSEIDCFYDGHFYYRCAVGNVLDMDKNCL